MCKCLLLLYSKLEIKTLKRYLLIATFEFEDNFLKKYDLTENDINTAIQKGQFAQFIFMKILSEVIIHGGQSLPSVELLLPDFLIKPDSKNSYRFMPPCAKTVEGILNDGWNENISLLELARETQVHPITISRHFRK